MSSFIWIINPCLLDIAVDLRKLCQEYYNIISKLESEKYDLEYQVRKIDYEIQELSLKVNDMRGKL